MHTHKTITDGATPLTGDAPDGAALCVLASGSSGNCSVLAIRRRSVTRVVIIDLGLSPRRTFAMLSKLGFGPQHIDCCLVTHLDADHFQPTWLSKLPAHATIRMHERHARELVGTLGEPAAGRVSSFVDSFDLDPGVRVHPLLMSHDELGVATFRIDLSSAGGGVLGFATDLGHVTADLIDHMRSSGGVDVLAIESNYCPRMQVASDRPEYLKRRIMGGSGHLSNQQAAEAVAAIEPKDHVVLLHLSRECNRPVLAAEPHEGADYALTIASQYEHSRWVSIGASQKPLRPGRWSTSLAQTATLWTHSIGGGA